MKSTLTLPSRRHALAAACCLTLLGGAEAADVVTVTAPRIAPTAYVPATTESVTSEQIAESINTVTTAGVLQYLPSTHVRVMSD